MTAGRYLLADQIGAGGMGTVWRAWDRRERRWVAVKVLSRYDAGSLRRFVREQGLRVRHRHVVQPTACAVQSGRTLFAMDLVRGGSVEQLAQRHGPLPEGYVRVLLDQTLQALVAVHAAGIVHRDVKPGNLLLEPTGTGRPWARLGDFGVAVVAGGERITRVPGGVGTGGYMAPEQAAGAAPDPRQDLYAVGMLARRLLTGSAPAACVTTGSSIDVLLDRLTDPDAGARPASAAAALDDLRALGVPSGAPWQLEPRPPDVIDLFARGRLLPRIPATARGAASAFVLAGLTGALAGWLVLR
jgi:eukaryotic-like serine/threonine-protein kinase